MKINNYSLDELKLKIHNIQKSYRELLENVGIIFLYKFQRLLITNKEI